MAHAIPEGQELLSVTSDPHQVEFLLDRAYYEEMAEIARASGSAFLEGYVRLSIDAANLRSAVRTLRMQKSAEFLKNVLFSGGNIDTGRTSWRDLRHSIEELYHISPLRDAAALGVAAVQGGSLTRFEKLCDDALTKYLKGAKLVGFGEQPVIGYLAARESELTAVRIIMTGRMAGLAPDTIRERLREAYV
jgi:V/A-type H+-transporting ATPase subunit C